MRLHLPCGTYRKLYDWCPFRFSPNRLKACLKVSLDSRILKHSPQFSKLALGWENVRGKAMALLRTWLAFTARMLDLHDFTYQTLPFKPKEMSFGEAIHGSKEGVIRLDTAGAKLPQKWFAGLELLVQIQSTFVGLNFIRQYDCLEMAEKSRS